MRLIGSGMSVGWGPRRRASARTLLRNARASKAQRRLEERCNELKSQLSDAHAQIERSAMECDENRQKILDYESRLNRMQSELMRAHSDVQRNRQLTVAKEENAAEKARIEVADRIMSVADDFVSALEVAQEQEMDPRWFDGFKAMAEKVDNCLAAVGYRRFESLGEDMDPSRHEALATMPTTDDMVGKVVQVIEAGYEDANTSKVVRVAKVLVGRSSGDPATN